MTTPRSTRWWAAGTVLLSLAATVAQAQSPDALKADAGTLGDVLTYGLAATTSATAR